MVANILSLTGKACSDPLLSEVAFNAVISQIGKIPYVSGSLDGIESLSF